MLALACILIILVVFMAWFVGHVIVKDVKRYRQTSLKNVFECSENEHKDVLYPSTVLKTFYVEVVDSLSDKGVQQWSVYLKQPKWKNTSHFVGSSPSKEEALKRGRETMQKMDELVRRTWMKEAAAAYKPSERTRI